MSTSQSSSEKQVDSDRPSNGEPKDAEGKKKLPQLGALEDDDEFEVGNGLTTYPIIRS